MAHHAEPTRAELDAALQELHAFGLLPSVPTLDAALAVPIYSRLLRMHALLCAAGVRTLAPRRQRPVVEAPEPPHPADAPWAPQARTRAPQRAARSPRAAHPTPRAHKPDLFDPKSAAAGERDDD